MLGNLFRRLLTINIVVKNRFDADAGTLNANIVGRKKIEIVFDKILTRQSSIDIRHSLRQTQHVVNNRIADIAV